MKRAKRLICFITVALLVVGITCVPSFAATSESCTNITGSTAATKVFKVNVTPKTYGYDYIKLSHYQKGKYVYEYKIAGYWTGNHKSKSAYGYYKITIKDSEGFTVKTLDWKNSKSIKINFGTWFKCTGEQFSNKTYVVTVRPYTKSEMRKTAHYGYEYWKTHSKWKVYKTRGVGSCKK